MPYGVRKVVAEQSFDFDTFVNEDVLKPTIQDIGMTPIRTDLVYEKEGALEAVWNAIQRADVVIVDFTTSSASVAMEYAFAAVLGKRMSYSLKVQRTYL
jgi:hypothetical protein